jgi:hypothetical protein
MKRLIIAIGLAGLLATGQAFGQPYGRPGPGGPPHKGGPGPQPYPAKQVDRERGGPPPGRYDRMSPEERRDLRRDIDKHGKDIYDRRGGRDRR